MKQKRMIPLPAEYVEFLVGQASYRTAMRVTEVMVYQSAVPAAAGYYVCPRCRVTMEREFSPFCSRCGQQLSWKGYKQAKMIYPGTG